MKQQFFHLTEKGVISLLGMMDPGEMASILVAEDNNYRVIVTWTGEYAPVYDFEPDEIVTLVGCPDM